LLHTSIAQQRITIFCLTFHRTRILHNFDRNTDPLPISDPIQRRERHQRMHGWYSLARIFIELLHNYL
jgi:hypothetical protein